MHVKFKSKKYEKFYQDDKYRRSKAGSKICPQKLAPRFVQRIDLIQEVRDLNDLKQLPGLHCHLLTGDLKGHYAVTLQGKWRLILMLEDNEQTVVVEEVSNHYE